MAKYHPLRDYLRKQKFAEFELSFAEMERTIGYMLSFPLRFFSSALRIHSAPPNPTPSRAASS